MDFVGAAAPLSDGDLDEEAQKLGCETATIWAVCEVESAGSGFLPDKRPRILFEAHYFHTLTNGVYDRSHPNISSPVWNQGLYGAAGAHQYDRLADAITLDRAAALQSASWGRFQIMGANHKAAGYSDAESFVQAIMDSETNHLLAFGHFCEASGLTGFLIEHDWKHFALRYNGPGQVANYAGKLAQAYEAHLSSNSASTDTDRSNALKIGDRGPAVLALQNDLLKLGYIVALDSIFGPHTASSVMAVQQKYHLPVNGVFDLTTTRVVEVAIKNLQ